MRSSCHFAYFIYCLLARTRPVPAFRAPWLPQPLPGCLASPTHAYKPYNAHAILLACVPHGSSPRFCLPASPLPPWLRLFLRVCPVLSNLALPLRACLETPFLLCPQHMSVCLVAPSLASPSFCLPAWLRLASPLLTLSSLLLACLASPHLAPACLSSCLLSPIVCLFALA
jgi:hypothetical protein